MAEDLKTQLERVQAAIAKIESGEQSFTVNGRDVTRPRLEALYQREADLLRRIASQERGGLRVRQIVPRG